MFIRGSLGDRKLNEKNIPTSHGLIENGFLATSKLQKFEIFRKILDLTRYCICGRIRPS